MIYLDDRLQNYNTVSRKAVGLVSREIAIDVPSWADTILFVDEVRKSILEADEMAAKAPASLETTLKVLEQVGERYGHWQDRECRHLKAALIGIGEPNTGRVPLERFYEEGLTKSKWMLVESVAYLKELGALDDSDPSKLSVIIPNYVSGHSNCIASGRYYDVCCIDKCNAIMAQIEKNFAGPIAKPEHIIAFVSNLASDSVRTPRTLSDSLVRRLSDVSDHHNGVVPFHGRLFAQWLHHAFPLDCPYPRVAGTIHSAVPNGSKTVTGADVVADVEVMR